MVSIGSVAVGSNMLRGVLTLPKAAEGDFSISFQKTVEDKWLRPHRLGLTQHPELFRVE